MKYRKKPVVIEAYQTNKELQAEVDELKQKNTDLLNVREVSNDDMERVLEVLRNIPVGPVESIAEAEQLPKRGEWIKDEEQSQKHVEAIYRCSACHNFDAWGETELYPYCPNCGARMDGGKDDLR